ncbi:hypothetical protein JW848_02855 [Candidatus Bipolaricaulota bacterium]|nr:hypothetical protein [Candidatus Bipolaricaulota bacterium]
MTHTEQAAPLPSLERGKSLSATGFIVHPTWRMRSGVSEIHLHGRLNTGETFLVIDSRERPGFYLRSSDRDSGRLIVPRFGGTLSPVGRRTMDGETTERVSVSAPGKLGPLRRALASAGIRTYEADVPFAWTYLIDRRLRGAIEISGSWRKGTTIDRVYRNPDLAPCDHEPRLTVAALALDPQTGAVRRCGSRDRILDRSRERGRDRLVGTRSPACAS